MSEISSRANITQTNITQTNIVKSFSCIGADCVDTCCQNWSMQLDNEMLEIYRKAAPELTDSVEQEADGSFVMRRNPQTRHCVKLEDGICTIHKKYGESFLGDACYFYPRAARLLGDKTIITASSSCPEIMRLSFELADPFVMAETSHDRLPRQIKDYLPDEINSDSALSIHQAFLSCALDESHSPQSALAYISSVARSMTLLQKSTLNQAIPVYLKLAAGRLPKAAVNQADAFNMLHALSGLIIASHKPISARLKMTISYIEESLQASIDWQKSSIALTEFSEEAWQNTLKEWQGVAENYQYYLRRFLALQLSLHLFPFAGLGNNPVERITFIGVRFAIAQLALACAHKQRGLLDQQEIISVMQSLSRFLDHLGDSQFSLAIYSETGWIKEDRLLAIINLLTLS